jgi:catechol 2,3-dioxygenase-like lactoylglutathione lyase family enzyme
VANIATATQFSDAAFGLDERLGFYQSEEPSTGFRGFTLSLTVSQPANADVLLNAATAAGATVLKPAAKSLWGYGGVVRAPDGTIWKVATAKRKNIGPATGDIDEMVLLLGSTDAVASKNYYTAHGIEVAKSYGRTYVQFALPGSPIQLGLYGYRGLARDAGIAAEGTGGHLLVVHSDAGTLLDPDGFVWDRIAAGHNSQ